MLIPTSIDASTSGFRNPVTQSPKIRGRELFSKLLLFHRNVDRYPPYCYAKSGHRIHKGKY